MLNIYGCLYVAKILYLYATLIYLYARKIYLYARKINISYKYMYLENINICY